jgi:hypothetical protein
MYPKLGRREYHLKAEICGLVYVFCIVVDYHDPVCSIRFVYFSFLFDTLLPIFVAACNGVLNRPTSLALSDRTRKKK